MLAGHHLGPGCVLVERERDVTVEAKPGVLGVRFLVLLPAPVVPSLDERHDLHRKPIAR